MNLLLCVPGGFFGHFMESDSAFRSDDFELKWSVHKAGDCKSASGTNSVAKTLCILLGGSIRFSFPDEDVVLN